jgi:hypothetical protein
MYTCLGGNETPIREYLQKGDWEMAMMQCLQASKNLRFGNSVVVSAMIRWLKNRLDSTNKIIIADNGKEMSIREFLDYVKEEAQQ